jgi:hypothetical protein
MSGIQACFQSHPWFGFVARVETRMRYLQPPSLETIMTSFPFTTLDALLFAGGIVVPLLFVLLARYALRSLTKRGQAEIVTSGETVSPVGVPVLDTGRVHDRPRQRVRAADPAPYPALRLEQGLRPDPVAGLVSDVGELPAASQG